MTEEEWPPYPWYFTELVALHDWPPGWKPAETYSRPQQLPPARGGWDANTIVMPNTPTWKAPSNDWSNE